ncbi:alpha/beta hydrolase [Sinimarinibacterium thermocellulolyticum]|uniref:Alpha/beta fold hydrolase n=1 Tax=Sinimarinibacterium thermocellulolyticum TaxID=3170016 RepID=A0ABV2A8J2_9GAMM
MSALPAAGTTAEHLIDGPAGRIEALWSTPRTARADAARAIVCHPHPLFGGAMSNKVAYTLASTAQKAGLHALRFNFRGVGRSEGVHDEGRGETADVVFLAGWLRERLGPGPLVLLGFSFGAWVSLRAAAALRPVAQVSIAPPFGKYVGDAGVPPRPPCPWLVVHGTDDEVVDYAQTRAVLDTYVPPPELVSLDGTGHFFHGRLNELSSTVLTFLQAHLD